MPFQRSNLRVLHLSSAKAFGGGERHLIDLVKGLTARGHELFVGLRPNSPLKSELTFLPNENFLELSLRNAIDARSADRLAAFVRNRKIEVVHAHMARDYPIAAYAALRNSPSSFIITRHVLFPLSRLHKLTLARVARVIAVSEAVGKQLRAEKLVPPEKITVVHNGVDIARFDSALERFDRQGFCRSWELAPEKLLIGSIGTLDPLKGHEEFLQAAAQIGKNRPEAHFIVAGIDVTPGEINKRRLELMIRDLGLIGRVTMIGKMEDITPLYCALDVLVSASRTESFGLAIAEAMAAETPPVATKTEGAQEIIKGGVTGFLVPLGDVNSIASTVEGLLKDTEKRMSIGRKARADIRDRFSLERTVDVTEAIYLEASRKIQTTGD